MRKNLNPAFQLGLAVLVLVALQLTTGCASFPGKQLPQVAPAEYYQVENKPSVYVDASLYTSLRGGGKQAVENFEAKQYFESYLKTSFDEAGIFNEISTNSVDALDMDLTVEIDFTNYGSYGGAVVAGIISGISFGFIPTWVKDKYSLEATVYDNQGNQLQQYHYADHMTTYIHLVFIPFVGSSKRAVEKVSTNMFRNLLNDLSQERFMRQYSQSGRMPETRGAETTQNRQPAQQEKLPSGTEKMEIRVIAPNAVVRLHADAESQVMAEIPVGVRMEVRDKKGEWFFVSFTSGENMVLGYIHQSLVEEIK